jgi:single-strand DNA-binding protein
MCGVSEGLNRVLLLGNLTADPETRNTGGGKQVTNIRLATTERYQDKDRQWKEQTAFHSVTLWGNRSVLEYLRKGTRVFVEGSLRTSSYEKNGEKRYKTEVVASNIILCGGRPKAEEPEDTPDPSGYGGDPPSDDDIPF